MELFKSQFGNVRIVEESGKVLFCGSDIAKALGYVNPNKAILDHCRCITKRDIGVNAGLGDQTIRMNFITEGDVYRLISHSKLPEAEKFERWVFDEVIPSIRKHGMYAEDEILDNPDLLIKVASKLKEEKEARILAEQKNETLQLTIESQKTKVLFADAIETSDDTISIGALAKLIQNSGSNLGRNKLFELLRKDGYLIKGGYDRNLPTQRVVKSGLMEIYESVIIKPNGDLMDTRTPVVTGKGQIYFVNKYKGYVQEAETKQIKTDKVKELQRLVDKLTRENKKLEGMKFDGEEHLGKFIEF